MKFKVGDVVVVHRPADVEKYPTWLSGMDMFKGKEAVVRKVVDDQMAALVRLDISEKYIFYALLIFSSITVSLNLHAVGGLLIYSLIALPSSTAYQLTHKIKTMYILSSLFAVGSCFSGLFASSIFHLPVGATIIIISCVIFGVSMLFSKKYVAK